MSQSSIHNAPSLEHETEIVAALIDRARNAMDEFFFADQARVDEAVTALAWAIYEPERARELAEKAVADTGLGNLDSKIIKNQRKTFGCLRDLMRVKTVGVIEENKAKGLYKYAKPVGVVAAIAPSTNPAATPVNKAMMALKGRNSVVVAPSPAGASTTTQTVEYMRAELIKIGLPADLVQVLPQPVNKALTQSLMEAADLVVVTGSQNNVRRAYSSGTPAIGVGAGNVSVIIDSTADLKSTAEKITMSKIFDNSTSCSSENQVIILEDVYDDAILELKKAGGYMTSADEKESIKNTLWMDGHLNRKVIAKDSDVFAKEAGLSPEAFEAKFFMVEDENPGNDTPFCDEKLSLVLTVYKARDFEDAMEQTDSIMDVCGRGHSVGIHTNNMDHARKLAENLATVRVLVNQAHTFGNGGSFTNGLPFTLSMGCGTWAGNSISENLNYRNFINITHLVTEIPEDKPSEDDLFGDYWEKFGK
jgi:sulfoacetaldehyde dehydrogenase